MRVKGFVLFNVLNELLPNCFLKSLDLITFAQDMHRSASSLPLLLSPVPNNLSSAERLIVLRDKVRFCSILNLATSVAEPRI